jgi:hypothetical protein
VVFATRLVSVTSHTCSVRAITRRITYFLCEHQTHITTPLNGLYIHHRLTFVLAINITVALWASTDLIETSLDFLPSDVSAATLFVHAALWLYFALILIPYKQYNDITTFIDVQSIFNGSFVVDWITTSCL